MSVRATVESAQGVSDYCVVTQRIMVVIVSAVRSDPVIRNALSVTCRRAENCM